MLIENLFDVFAERNINELIKARKDDPYILSRYNQSPQKLSSQLREYVDGEGTVFLLDKEEREMSFKAYGFICGMALPLNLLDMAKKYVVFLVIVTHFQRIFNLAGTVSSQALCANKYRLSAAVASCSQNLLPLNGHYILSWLARLGENPFVHSCPNTSRESNACLLLLVFLPSKHLAMTLWRSIFQIPLTTAVVYVTYAGGRDSSSPKTTWYATESWHLPLLHRKSICVCVIVVGDWLTDVYYFYIHIGSGFDVVDVPLSYLTVGQLVEIKISFRGHKLGRSYSFRGKLNSVVVYNDDVSRVMTNSPYLFTWF